MAIEDFKKKNPWAEGYVEGKSLGDLQKAKSDLIAATEKPFSAKG